MFLRNVAILVCLGVIFLFSFAQARENVTDWYIKDLRAEFVLASDSTMVVTEWITADCGQCTGKHGIFRVLPTEARTETDAIKTPVELLEITDFQGKPYKYTEIQNSSDATVTWKIGDANTFVTGVHEYKIVYQVKNVVRFSNQAFDEWYWNINGNFWTMSIDAFSATLIFPDTVRKEDATLAYYTGMLGSKENSLARVVWQNEHTLLVTANRGLLPGEGITVSVTFPKNQIFTPYQFGWWELYGKFFWLLLPIVTFWFSFRVWRKYGDDPAWDKVVIPEYEAPEHLDALETGLMITNGTLAHSYVTAGIIELAVKGYIVIREEEQKILIFTTKEFILEKQAVPEDRLSSHQQLLLQTLFASGNQVKLTVLKKTFYKVLEPLKKEVIDSLAKKGLIEKKSLSYRIVFIIIAVILFGFSIILGATTGNSFGALAGIFSGAIIFIFGLIMPKRTLSGTEVDWKIQGFKLYMNTAEKHRQQFYEKEHLFEALLPYAIVFGITKEWVKKMQDMYGEEYFSGYHPAWFVAGNMDGFSADTFATQLESLSADIAANTGTSSGSGGSGSSGGGGGGGGGGGW